MNPANRWRFLWFVLAPALFTGATGCTSALSSAYLKGLPWDMAESTSEPLPPEPESLTAGGSDGEADRSDGGANEASPDDDGERRAAAIDEAVSRLTRLGRLNEASAAALVATLRTTEQQDWPVVIAEFSEALAAANSDRAVPPEAASPAAGSPPLEPTPPAAAVEPAPAVAASIAAEGDERPSPAPAGLRIANACFATRVQAWGVVERFPESRFQAGREVIVYFELDGLTAKPSDAGHTTCIDTSLRLVDRKGAAIHEWHFEPIAETCAGRRRDYFARYVVQLPGDLPTGDCHLEVRVIDTLADGSAVATLPLEIVAAEANAG